MPAQAVAFELAPVPGCDIPLQGDCDPYLGDLRFRALLRDSEWSSLPLAIRRRFSKRLRSGGVTVYAGEVLETRMSPATGCWRRPCGWSARRCRWHGAFTCRAW